MALDPGPWLLWSRSRPLGQFAGTPRRMRSATRETHHHEQGGPGDTPPHDPAGAALTHCQRP